MAVNCGAIPSQLLESELFGYVKGAFTGASADKHGLFYEARGGTIFLDEIGELPIDLQVKLLRVLEEKEIRRVGDTRSIKVDVRVVSATSRDLPEEIKSGKVQGRPLLQAERDQYMLPPLRERKGDIRILAAHFTEHFNGLFAKGVSGISDGAMKELEEYNWPGNVRELENVIERAVILEEGKEISADNFPFNKGGSALEVCELTGASNGLSIKKRTA